MTRPACASLRELEDFIDDSLSPEQAARLIAHVESCENCQILLERLVARPVDDCLGAASSGAQPTADLTGHSTAARTHLNGTPPEPTEASMSGAHVPGATTEHRRDGDDIPRDPGATADQDSRDLDGTLSRSGQGAPHDPGHRDGARNPSQPRIPGYELLRTLGEGGMGVVYLARQTGLNRKVAVKMIRGGPQARPDHFARFRVEAEAVAQLRHPGIVQIYEIGEIHGLPYFSLEFLEGGSLADRLDGTPQPGRKAAELLITLCEAVQVAHDAGIVHRDLKPSNVLFSEQGVAKVADFGLAKKMDSDSRQTETGAIMGSPS